MGKGDVKTKKGKISKGSFGVSRPHKKKATTTEKPKAKAKTKKKK
ncbi:RPS31 30S ribosomal protein S31 [Reichenbachiella faecimaris]|uniref:RPS31 30S ribosomal protein S31 n=1 Tax=Reichenbachiella faecimaris TaxID=692418 RepID=A0A1W2G800_REIFA|nr:30S ribosomal protein THX [Reichenbachiella faecimaris]SMD32731.1 RPS31 30S ribosomal protein S31 [Reichenbachiella faecimaris]